METVEKIDSDVESLNSELDRHDGKRRFHCDKRCKYFLVGVGLLLAMFLFGMITRPAPKTVTVTEVVAVLDTEAPRVVQPELDERISHLRKVSRNVSAPLSVLTSTATEPRILTWTPASVGKTNPDGTPVPLVGSYEVPGGWFGAIRLLADGEEIGSTVVDVRSIASASQGRFSISPRPIEGEKSIHLVFDAVKACRIACDPLDQLCMATNVNYCTPLYDNQTFDTYIPKMAVALPPPGQCVTKVFVGGPKYAPQIPEDYTMCEKGMWNSNIGQEAEVWLTTNLGERVTQADVGALASSLSPALASGSGLESIPDGQSGNISWSVHYKKGEAELGNACMIELVVRVDCEDNTQASIRSVSEMFTQMSNKTREIGGVVVASLQSVFLPRVAYAQSERCGSAANVPAVDRPSSGLCDSGTPTVVYADSGVWNWLCLGPSGLASDPATQWCNAPYALPSTPPSVAPSPYTCGTWQYEMVPNPATQVVLNPNVSPFVSNADFANYANQCAVYATNNSLAQYSCGVVDGGCYTEVTWCSGDYSPVCTYADVCNSYLAISSGPLVPAGPGASPQEGISCTPNPVTPPSMPDLTVTSPVNFGSVPVGVVGVPRTFTITNNGTAAFNGSISFPNNGAYESYTCVGGPSVSVSANGASVSKTCTLRTSLAAPLGGTAQVSDGTYTKTFAVTATAAGTSKLDVARSGYPTITVSPYVVAMGTVAVSDPVIPYDFEIRNSGSSVMNYSVNVTGGGVAYTLTDVTAGGCSGTGVANGDPVRVCRVSFNPGAPGAGNGSIRFDNTSAAVSAPDPIDVNFTATASSNAVCELYADITDPLPPVTITGGAPGGFTVDFGTVNTGSSRTRDVIINNGGDSVLVGSHPVVVDADYDAPGGTFNLVKNSQHIIPVTFHPLTTGPQTYTITLPINDPLFPGGSMNIVLRGIGNAVPSLTVNPTSVGFPSWDIYSGGITRDFTITNNGSVS